MKDALLTGNESHHVGGDAMNTPLQFQALQQPTAQQQVYDLNPTVTHYRLGRLRPTVAQLRRGEHQRSHLKIEAPPQEGAGHTVGTFIGVLCPCFDNIVNIVYFVRLPLVIAAVGGLATMIGWVVSFFLVLVSIISLSAMVTNGEVETGGSYYLISRTIGPEAGGSCGFCLAFASLIGASTAHLGLMETIVILYSPKTVFGSQIWDVRIFSSLMCVAIGYLSNFGFSIRLAMFFFIWLGVIMYFLGLIFPKYTKAKDLLQCSTERFKENWAFTNLDIYQVFYTFSIIFPGFGGILAGSNSTGALKRPQVSIPLGSIIALVLGLIIFISTSLTLTSCHPKSQLASEWTIPLQDSSFLNWFVFAAIAATSIAKGITGLGTGPMVLRAMAQDGIIHKWFGEHSRVFGTVFSICFCLYGDFNRVSSLSAMLFLAVFSFLNHGTFLAKYSKAASFRPHFKFYSPVLSLIVCFLCIISMFLINWATASLAIFAAAAFYYYLRQQHIDAPWGTLSQSSAYNNGLVAALRLRHVPPHPKLFRPNVALFIQGQLQEHHQSITFLDQMLNDNGMAVVARIFDPTTNLSDVVKERTNCSIKTTRNNYHIFYETVVAKNMREALNKVMLLTGLANLRPNVVFVEFDESLGKEQPEFVMDVIDNKWPIMVVRRPTTIEDFGTIDCWSLSEDGGLALLMASILSNKGRKLRVLTFARLDVGESIEEQGQLIRHVLKRYRVVGEVVIIPLTDSHMPSHHSQMIWEQSLGETQEDMTCREQTMHYMRIADAIRAHSSHSLVTVISMPRPPNTVSGSIYMRWLNLVSSIPSSVLFVRGNGTPALSWQV